MTFLSGASFHTAATSNRITSALGLIAMAAENNGVQSCLSTCSHTTQTMLNSAIHAVLQITNYWNATDDYSMRFKFVFDNHTTLVSKNVPLCNCPYLRQILTDFKSSSSYTFCGVRTSSSVVRLLNVPPHLNCVATLPCQTQIIVKSHKNSR